ncbi:MAG: UDP-N-acetylmuramoyl-tripeptide--D-alanyl-D-alanine ligase, partial [Ruminococcus sp.]|nr:UDP-N-acetylmuramoyl-tripeptide--D-alanyl-D-alanine ligase [Ruminococcus sp.]
MEMLQLSEIAKALKCSSPVDAEITDICTDTRKLQAGCLFLALKGANFDGHNFVEKAIADGAVAAVTDHQVGKCPCIIVKDTGLALLKIASYYRSKFNPILVGVTGSVGKTTTKEMIALVLSAQFETLKTQGNLNNEIGLPKTLLGLQPSHAAAVIEMGMSHFGEIHRLSCTTKPTIGVITNIGFSHIENLKTQEGILKAKLEILDGMQNDAPLVINGDDPMLAPLADKLERPVYTYGLNGHNMDVTAVDICEEDNTTRFIIQTLDGSRFSAMIPCVGIHNVMNALAAFCVGRIAGIEPEVICKALGNYETVGYRQNIEQYGPYTVIADCYNASPDSMNAALQVLKRIDTDGRRVAVLGDMLELGTLSQKLHSMVGEMAASSNADQIFCYGDAALAIARSASALGASVFHTDDVIELCSAVRAYLRPGDVVLFKASRGMKLETWI